MHASESFPGLCIRHEGSGRLPGYHASLIEVTEIQSLSVHPAAYSANNTSSHHHLGIGQAVTEIAATPHKKTNKSITIWVLSVISIAYIVIVYFLIKETATCSEVLISANWFKGFWDEYLGCRSVNELGDALAGAFAPVAFLWLMGAVFIQSQELKAQREELNETQEVMREQLAVAKEQVKETKNSTILFEKQTEILEADRKTRIVENNDKILQAAIDAFEMSLFNNINMTFDSRAAHQLNWQTYKILDETHHNADLRSVVFGLCLKLAQIEIDIGSSKTISYKIKGNAIQRLCEGIDWINKLKPNTSPQMQIRTASYGLESFQEHLEKIQNELNQTSEDI
jgi:hypothetical protein